jgi:hypothetical protein
VTTRGSALVALILGLTVLSRSILAAIRKPSLAQNHIASAYSFLSAPSALFKGGLQVHDGLGTLDFNLFASAQILN